MAKKEITFCKIFIVVSPTDIERKGRPAQLIDTVSPKAGSSWPPGPLVPQTVGKTEKMTLEGTFNDVISRLREMGLVT